MCRWTWAPAAAAWTWAHRRCAWPACRSRLKQLGRQVEDIGNVAVPQPEEQHYGEKHAKYLDEIAETCNGLAEMVRKDPRRRTCCRWCSAATIRSRWAPRPALPSIFANKSKRIGLIWLDAHGDMNTPETFALRQRSRHAAGVDHGLRAAGTGRTCAGIKPMVEPRNVALVGIRDLDSKERRLMKESGVHVFTMRDIDERGMREVMAEALRFASDDTAGIAVSLDMDFVDPIDAPGVGTPVRGGVTYREAHLALEMIADSKSMVSFELVEINPVIDLHNTTATLGVELVLSGLGKKIL